MRPAVHEGGAEMNDSERRNTLAADDGDLETHIHYYESMSDDDLDEELLGSGEITLANQLLGLLYE